MKNNAPKEFYNRKARFDYNIESDLEVGVVLTGEEIKAVRAGKINLTGSYVRFLSLEPYWVGGNISILGDEKDRSRKLLLKKIEIKRLLSEVEQKKVSVVPLKAYFKKGRLKILIGIGKGKKKFDKREDLKRRDLDREIQRKTKV